MIGERKSLGKLRKERFGAGVGVRLEHTPELLVRVVACSLQGCRYLRRMMSVVVDDCEAAAYALYLKTSVNAAVAGNSPYGSIKVYSERYGCRYGSETVVNVVFARNLEGNLAPGFIVV